MSGTKLEKHLNDRDSSGNYVSTLARHPKLTSVDRISDFPQNGHSMSTSNTTTTLGFSAISNEPTTPVGANQTIQSIHSFTSSSSSSNHHYQSMEDARLSFEGGRKIDVKLNQEGKISNDDGQHSSYQYQNHYEKPSIKNSRMIIDTTQHTLQTNGAMRNEKFHSSCNNASRQQTMSYLPSSQLLPEHLRSPPDNTQHSILTSSDIRNQNRIKNIKMHPRTNDGSNDNTRTRWRWLLTRLRKSSSYSQSSSGTSSTSTSLSSATHSSQHASHHPNSHFQHNKNHYNNQANNDLFMYHQQDITAPPCLQSSSFGVGGQFLHPASIDLCRQPLNKSANAATTLKDPLNLRTSHFEPHFISTNAKFHYNGQFEEYPAVRASKSIETGLKVETNHRSSRYPSSDRNNYHKSQELSYNSSDGHAFMLPTNHASPLNGLNHHVLAKKNNHEQHIFDDNGMYDYSRDMKMNHHPEPEIDQNIWLQKTNMEHHDEIDSYNVLPVPYDDYHHENTAIQEDYSDQNIERSERLSNSSSSESSGDLRNEVTRNEAKIFVPVAKEKRLPPQSKARVREKTKKVCLLNTHTSDCNVCECLR